MDLGLPGMSGIEVAQFIKHNRQISKIPIIALSGHQPELWEETALDAGISLYLAKPASLDDIIKAIAQVLAASSDS
jgi:CheY-like chemotaxis protein